MEENIDIFENFSCCQEYTNDIIIFITIFTFVLSTHILQNYPLYRRFPIILVGHVTILESTTVD